MGACTAVGPLPGDAVTYTSFRPPNPPTWCVVLAHGGGNDRLAYMWEAIEGLLRRSLAVVTADLPGHGEGASDMFSVAASRRRLDELVAAGRREAPRVAILGHSLGGAFALDRLARGGPADAIGVASVPLTLELGSAALGELRAVVSRWVWQQLHFAPLVDLLPAFGPINRMRYPVRVPGRAGYLAAFRAALAELALAERLARRDYPALPVTIWHGSRDGIVPLDHGRRLAAALGPTAELRVISGAGHFDVLLRPQVIAAIADWLEGLATDPAGKKELPW